MWRVIWIRTSRICMKGVLVQALSNSTERSSFFCHSNVIWFTFFLLCFTNWIREPIFLPYIFYIYNTGRQMKFGVPVQTIYRPQRPLSSFPLLLTVLNALILVVFVDWGILWLLAAALFCFDLSVRHYCVWWFLSDIAITSFRTRKLVALLFVGL